MKTELTPEEMARLREAFARVPFAHLLGMRFESAERGEATFSLDAREELTRMEGILHGGALAALLDTAAAFAVHTLLEPGQRTLTVDLTVHFLRPVAGGQVKAHARVLREGRRIVVITVEAVDRTGTLIATATTTYVKHGEIQPSPSSRASDFVRQSN
ncbi:MAG: PaaI family thioesterase [Acidobacteria bacterium]|nr:PaaI family thioesterase [Acidobacteriota bacterium]